MARFIPAAERIKKARLLIQQALDLPVPEGMGRSDLSYIARVKGLLRDARDLVKFIPMTPSATPEMKADVVRIFEEADEANHKLFRLGS